MRTDMGRTEQLRIPDTSVGGAPDCVLSPVSPSFHLHFAAQRHMGLSLSANFFCVFMGPAAA